MLSLLILILMMVNQAQCMLLVPNLMSTKYMQSHYLVGDHLMSQTKDDSSVKCMSIKCIHHRYLHGSSITIAYYCHQQLTEKLTERALT